MADSEPDIAELFAPLRPAQAADVVLSEAREVLPHLRKPIDAELWGSDMIGALSRHPAATAGAPAPGTTGGRAAGPGTVGDSAAGAGAAGDTAGDGAPAAGAPNAGGTDAGGTKAAAPDAGGTNAGAPDAGGADVMAELAVSLVPAAERDATPEALALLRVLGAIGSPELRAAATAAAERVAGHGVQDPEWAAAVGSPAVGRSWHYSDIGGRQESVTVSFGYGESEHALSVLIDHGNGGRIKDAWVDDAEGLLDKTWLAAENDPLVVFEPIESADAARRLATAVAAGESPTKPDEADDLTAHRALLHARLRYLTAN